MFIDLGERLAEEEKQLKEQEDKEERARAAAVPLDDIMKLLPKSKRYSEGEMRRAVKEQYAKVLQALIEQRKGETKTPSPAKKKRGWTRERNSRSPRSLQGRVQDILCRLNTHFTKSSKG